MEEKDVKNEIITKTNEYQQLKLETMKRNFPRYLKKRKREFAKELAAYMDENSVDGALVNDDNIIPLYEIIDNVFSPIVKSVSASPAYSADEFAVAFDFYKSCSVELNKKSKYVPNIEDFCNLLNISRKTFDRYQQTSPDENMREMCDKIQTFCTARTLNGAITGKLEKTYSIFHQKSSNNQRDNDPVNNNTFIQNNTILTDEQFNELAKKLTSND